MFVNWKKICNLKADNGIIRFPIQFYLWSMFHEFGATESREVSLKGNEYDFSVDYNASDNSEKLNIQKYLMVKSNTK